jgi:hypothetical protein
MGRLTLALLAVLALPAAAGATSGATIVQNGRFTDVTGGLPSGWRTEAWARDLSDFGWEAGPSGNGMARIINRGANDARFCQTIAVTPGATYRVSAQVKTEGIGAATAGALIAIEPRIADSIDTKGTQDWQLVQVNVENPDASQWDICLRLGSYANLNTGTAWFTDVRVDQIGGAAPRAESRLPRLSFGPSLATLKQTPWFQIAAPLIGGLLLALGLGVIGRTPR